MTVFSRLPETIKRPLRPVVQGARAAAFHAAALSGAKKRYAIAAGYRHRADVAYCDAHEVGEEWQREVYLAALSLMTEKGLRTVCDVGCGTGAKLIQLLGKFDTLGLDLPQTIERVREHYPDRRWIAGTFEELRPRKFDVVICADVIEHVADPLALMETLADAAAEAVVVSTPDRELLYSALDRWRYGPPSNPSHLREWTMEEFREFVDSFLEVQAHVITNRGHGTQMVVGKPRPRYA